MRRLDSNEAFEKDDEVGISFRQIIFTIENLDRELLQYDDSEEDDTTIQENNQRQHVLHKGN